MDRADRDPADLHAERARRRQRLAVALRLFARLDFDEGTAGHISVRDPLRPDCFWINPFGRPFALLRAGDLVLVGPGGDVVEGDGRVGRAAFFIHSCVYAARADVGSVAHAHPVHGKAWAALGRPLDPINQEACIFFRTHEVFDEFHGAVKDDREGTAIAARLGRDASALVLRNHGLLTVGAGVEEAAYRFVIMDRSCRVQLLAEAAGTPTLVDEAVALDLAAEGDAYCRMCFEPIFEHIATAQPDVLS
jgi:ribulose-5-phosphate 4-epimerase/fuculose-1-phosphate aldolase